MKKIFIICFLLSFSLQPVFAQPTQAEIEKIQKQAQDAAKKYGGDSTVSKAMKDAKEKQQQVSDALKNQQGSNAGAANSLYSSDPGSYGNIDNWKFPPKNTALLAALPKKILTKAELISFLNDVYSQLSKIISQGVHSSVQSIAAKYNNDGIKMGDAAITGWYTNYQEEALLLMIKASVNNPDDGLLLNNCAAMLNMSGIEHKAIPVLKYVLQSYSESSMLLNNLGQAYAGLGETDTAMFYFGRCIKIEPKNSEANNTAGQIEATKGNTEKAIAYLEKSIEGAYSKTASLKLRKLKKDASIVPLIRPRVKIPEYFNLFKYELPAQCTSTDNAAMAQAEHNAFREMISKQAQLYGSKYAELSQKKMQQGMQIMNANGAGRILNKGEILAHPVYEQYGEMANGVQREYEKETKDFSSRVVKKYSTETTALENEYKSKLKIINDGFEERGKNCGEGKANNNCPTAEEKCIAYNNLANQYLPKFAAFTVDIQKKGMLLYQKYFDELSYWHYLSLRPTGVDNFRIRYFEFIQQYLAMMYSVCQTKIIEPCEFVPTSATAKTNTFKDIDCPIDIVIGLGIGKLIMNCEMFSISGGEGVIFGYEKIFKTKQSTVSVGIGVRLELGIKVGPVGASIGAQATKSAFITIDGNNEIADFGVQNEAKLTSEAPYLGRNEIGIGSRVGINSGCNYNVGHLKGKIGPAPEKQINKNVPIYKPKEGWNNDR